MTPEDRTLITVIAGAVITMLTTLGTHWINRGAVARVDKKMDAQDQVLAVVSTDAADAKKNTDGLLSAEKDRGDKALAEVERRAREPDKPTKFGEPDAEHPVTLSAGKAITAAPERPERPPPSDNEPRPPALPWEPASTTPMKNVEENTRKADP